MKGKRGPTPVVAKRLDIARLMRAEGKTLREIGAALGMSLTATHEMCRRYEIRPPYRALKWHEFVRQFPQFPGIVTMAKRQHRIAVAKARVEAYWNHPAGTPKREQAA